MGVFFKAMTNKYLDGRKGKALNGREECSQHLAFFLSETQQLRPQYWIISSTTEDFVYVNDHEERLVALEKENLKLNTKLAEMKNLRVSVIALEEENMKLKSKLADIEQNMPILFNTLKHRVEWTIKNFTKVSFFCFLQASKMTKSANTVKLLGGIFFPRGKAETDSHPKKKFLKYFEKCLGKVFWNLGKTFREFFCLWKIFSSFWILELLLFIWKTQKRLQCLRTDASDLQKVSS